MFTRSNEIIPNSKQKVLWFYEILQNWTLNACCTRTSDIRLCELCLCLARACWLLNSILKMSARYVTATPLGSTPAQCTTPCGVVAQYSKEFRRNTAGALYSEYLWIPSSSNLCFFYSQRQWPWFSLYAVSSDTFSCSRNCTSKSLNWDRKTR